MPRLTHEPNYRAAKFAELRASEGYDNDYAFLFHCSNDSVCPGICMGLGCDYTIEVEPDQDRGWCEACGKQSVASALILTDMI